MNETERRQAGQSSQGSVSIGPARHLCAAPVGVTAAVAKGKLASFLLIIPLTAQGLHFCEGWGKQEKHEVQLLQRIIWLSALGIPLHSSFTKSIDQTSIASLYPAINSLGIIFVPPFHTFPYFTVPVPYISHPCLPSEGTPFGCMAIFFSLTPFHGSQ